MTLKTISPTVIVKTRVMLSAKSPADYLSIALGSQTYSPFLGGIFRYVKNILKLVEIILLMLGSMFGLRNKFKVLNTVIEFIAVDVMNDLFRKWQQLSTKILLHNEAVFKGSFFSLDSNSFISPTIKATATFLFPKLGVLERPVPLIPRPTIDTVADSSDKLLTRLAVLNGFFTPITNSCFHASILTKGNI